MEREPFPLRWRGSASFGDSLERQGRQASGCGSADQPPPGFGGPP